jgi:predicted RNase H-like HicB family nuclease
MDTKKNLKYYLNLNWTYNIEPKIHDGKPYYIIRVNELPGVCTDSENLDEGMLDIKEVIQGAIELYLKNGEEIPEPLNKERFKGNISYRTSRERHYYIAKLAQQQHTSLSKTLDMIVDTGIQQLKFNRI